MDIVLVFNKMIMMLLMLMVGVVVAKTGVVDKEGNRRLSRFALAVPQSATIIASAMTLDTKMSAGQVLGLLGVGCVMYALLIALGLLVPVVCRMKRENRGLYTFLTVFGNVGFMGIPMAQSLFGAQAGFYAAMLMVPFNILVFTLGVRLMNGGKKEPFDWHKLFSPALVASVLAVAIIFLPFRWPSPVVDAVKYMGDMILPLSMVIIGASLGEQKLRDVLLDWRVYLFSPVKLVIAPVLLWAVMGPFIRDPMLLGTLTLVGAMPSAAVAVMQSIQYGANEQSAARTVFMTTVLSVVTIPFVCWLLLT